MSLVVSKKQDEYQDDSPGIGGSFESFKFQTNIWINDFFSDIIVQIDYETEVKIIALKSQIFKNNVRSKKQEEAYEFLCNRLNFERSNLIRLINLFKVDCYERSNKQLLSQSTTTAANQDFLYEWKSKALQDRTIFYHDNFEPDDAIPLEIESNMMHLGKIIVITGIYLDELEVEVVKKHFNQSHIQVNYDTLNRAYLFLLAIHQETMVQQKQPWRFSYVLLDPSCNIVHISVEDIINSKNTELKLFKRDISRLESFTFNLLRNDRSGSVFSNLRLLDISFNKLEKINSQTFFGLVNLQQLNLNQNKIHSIEPNAWHSLISLKRLFLNNNQIAKLQENAFHHLCELVELNLANNMIENVQAFEGLSSLAFLNLKSNRLGGHLDMQIYKQLAELVELDLSNNYFQTVDFIAKTDPDCECIFKSLVHLNLSHNKLQKIIQHSNTAIYSSLVRLDLSFNHLSIVELKGFAARFTALKWLNFSNNSMLSNTRITSEPENETNQCKYSQLVENHLKYIEYFIV